MQVFNPFTLFFFKNGKSYIQSRVTNEILLWWALLLVTKEILYDSQWYQTHVPCYRKHVYSVMSDKKWDEVFYSNISWTLGSKILRQKESSQGWYKSAKRNIALCNTWYNPSVANLKHILMEKWHLIESQPKLKEMFKEPPIISYKRGISLRDILVRAKL